MTMEFDDLKAAWLALDRRMALQTTIDLALLRDQRLTRIRRGLWPLFVGQLVLMAFGVLMLLLGVATWTGHRAGSTLFIAGIIMHVYGVVVLIAAGRTLALVGQVDYAAPVVAIQRQLLELRRWYIGSSAAVGLPWWLLWIVFIMCLGQVDLVARAPMFVTINVAIGVIGLAVTWWFHRWVRRPGRQAQLRRLDDGAAGKSIVRAQSELDELADFERE